MNIHEEKQLFLEKELKEYEKQTPMTEKERQMLHEWVADGNSVHDNGWYACLEGGMPMDFPDAYRQILEEDAQMDAIMNTVQMDPGKRPFPPLPISDQRRRIRELYRRYMLCWEVIVMNDLRDEASEYIREHLLDSIPFDVVTDWF